MGRVRYREPSENYEKIAAKKSSGHLRPSIGHEQSIGEYYFISIENLIPYHKQARRNFDEKEIKELARTIEEHGVKTPLLVIPSSLQAEKFEVVCGERRLRASKEIGLEKLPCIIIDEKQAEEVALIDNIQRAELHPIEIGDGINSLLENSGRGDLTKLAEKLGKDQSTISNYLSYSRLPYSIKKYLIDKNIRARDVLRKVLKCDSLTKMEKFLGLTGQSEVATSKSLLRINMNHDKIHVQDKYIYKIDNKQREEVKNILKGILKKIDELDNPN